MKICSNYINWSGLGVVAHIGVTVQTFGVVMQIVRVATQIVGVAIPIPFFVKILIIIYNLM